MAQLTYVGTSTVLKQGSGGGAKTGNNVTIPSTATYLLRWRCAIGDRAPVGYSLINGGSNTYIVGGSGGTTADWGVCGVNDRGGTYIEMSREVSLNTSFSNIRALTYGRSGHGDALITMEVWLIS